MIRRLINGLKLRLKRAFFCYWCLELYGIKRIGSVFGRFPKDVIIDWEVLRSSPVMGDICLCAEHFKDFKEKKGIFAFLRSSIKKPNKSSENN